MMDEKLSRETGLPLLGAIPLDLELRQGGDTGMPLMASAPDSEAGRIFQKIAKELSEKTEEFCQWPRQSDRENLDREER